MSQRNDDVERIRQIRDRQIQLRDPQKKVDHLQHKIAKRRKSAITSFSIGAMVDDVPKKWRGFLLGMALGVVVLILLPSFVDPPMSDFIGFGAIIFLAIIGFLLGQAMDARDRINELMR